MKLAINNVYKIKRGDIIYSTDDIKSNHKEIYCTSVFPSNVFGYWLIENGESNIDDNDRIIIEDLGPYDDFKANYPEYFL